MEMKYELHLGNLHVLRKANELTNVVVSIEYTYSGSTVIDGQRYVHGITRSATVLKNVEDLNHDNMIDYNDITKDMATQWVRDTFSEYDLLTMNGIITANIEQQTMYAVKLAPWNVVDTVQIQHPTEPTKG
jgi:hypothetical protein